MKATEYRKQNADGLLAELLKLRKEQLSLRVQRSTGQLGSHARFKELRRDIARIKTVLNERESAPSARLS